MIKTEHICLDLPHHRYISRPVATSDSPYTLQEENWGLLLPQECTQKSHRNKTDNSLYLNETENSITAHGGDMKCVILDIIHM